VMYGATDGVAGAPPMEGTDRAVFSALILRLIQRSA
jgi:hypothetical protein